MTIVKRLVYGVRAAAAVSDYLAITIELYKAVFADQISLN